MTGIRKPTPAEVAEEQVRYLRWQSESSGVAPMEAADLAAIKATHRRRKPGLVAPKPMDAVEKAADRADAPRQVMNRKARQRLEAHMRSKP